MAKGRRASCNGNERYLGGYGYGGGHTMDGGDETELDEDEVWSMGDAGDGREVHSAYSPPSGSESNSSNGSFSYTSIRSFPREGRHVGGLSLAFEDSAQSSEKAAPSRIITHYGGPRDGVGGVPPFRHVATSAPVNVPNWCRIYGGTDDAHGGVDDTDKEIVPPHEYLAREYARNQKMSGASVFEGVGRTLKGRDLRRVRDAVWRHTGFDG